MGLNPGDSNRAEQLRQKILDDNFNYGSPYHGMYHCGYYGVPIEEAIAKCQRNGIALRKKDFESYNDGVFKRGIGKIICNGQMMNIADIKPTTPFENMKLSDVPKMPVGWVGTERRFFPCTQDNRPMQKWGWSQDFSPELYVRADAKALSPCGWVGHNLLYQKFIVLDIDGRGHGEDDQFREHTFTVEDPMKPGSFHLYFATDRLIPIRHFPWAKLDLMGNAANAAVYFKNKVSNGVPMMTLNDDVWNAVIEYQKRRKEKTCR